MFSIILVYIVIIIIQVIYTINMPLYSSSADKLLDEKIKFNIENHDKLDKIFSEKVLSIANEINNSDLNLQATIDKYYKDKSIFYVDNQEYYISIVKKIQHPATEIKSINFMHLLSPNSRENNMIDEDVIFDTKEDLLNTHHTISQMLNNNIFNLSSLGQVSYSKYYYIDKFSGLSIQKLAFFARIHNKYNEEGVVVIGYDIENYSTNTKFKYSEYIYKTELVFVSVITLTIALLMSKFGKSNFKAILLLVVTNIYILYFINTTENKATNSYENVKSDQINNSLLGLTFLTGVNIYIIQEMYKKNRKLFIETSFVFAISIILLLIACYKSTNKNTLNELIGARITNQLAFNLCVILNVIIIINFIIHSFTSIKK